MFFGLSIMARSCGIVKFTCKVYDFKSVLKRDFKNNGIKAEIEWSFFLQDFKVGYGASRII